MWAVIFIAWVYSYTSLLLKPLNRRGMWRAAVSELVWALESGVGGSGLGWYWAGATATRSPSGFHDGGELEARGAPQSWTRARTETRACIAWSNSDQLYNPGHPWMPPRSAESLCKLRPSHGLGEFMNEALRSSLARALCFIPTWKASFRILSINKVSPRRNLPRLKCSHLSY